MLCQDCGEIHRVSFCEPRDPVHRGGDRALPRDCALLDGGHGRGPSGGGRLRATVWATGFAYDDAERLCFQAYEQRKGWRDYGFTVADYAAPPEAEGE